MAVSHIKTNTAYDILKNYNGENPYMLLLYKKVYVDKDVNAMNETNINFIINNKDFEPVTINKIIKVADWWAEKKKEDWGLEFLPVKIKILS